MPEIIIEISQIENIEKYKTGMPNTAPSKLNIKINGILYIKNNARESTMSFCS